MAKECFNGKTGKTQVRSLQHHAMHGIMLYALENNVSIPSGQYAPFVVPHEHAMPDMPQAPAAG